LKKRTVNNNNIYNNNISTSSILYIISKSNNNNIYRINKSLNKNLYLNYSNKSIYNNSKSKSKSKSKEKDNISYSSSISNIKDNNYYKNESKKLKDYIKEYYLKYKTYPKTKLKFYKIGRRLGNGAFGKVNLALHILSGHIVAIKSFNKKKNYFNKSQILYEIKLMKILRGHKNIVNFFEYFETDKYNCIVMENISGGNLLNLINKMTKLNENISKFIFKQLIETIKYIHSKNIVHRDIKLDNILIDINNNIKLCYFGISLKINKGILINDQVGTPAFIA